MKLKNVFILSAALLACSALRAQNYVMDDFESGKVSFTDAVNVNPEGSGKFEVVDNPASNDVNVGNIPAWLPMMIGQAFGVC